MQERPSQMLIAQAGNSNLWSPQTITIKSSFPYQTKLLKQIQKVGIYYTLMTSHRSMQDQQQALSGVSTQLDEYKNQVLNNEVQTSNGCQGQRSF